MMSLNTDLKITGVAVSKECVAVWSGKTMAVYNLTEVGALNVVGKFRVANILVQDALFSIKQ